MEVVLDLTEKEGLTLIVALGFCALQWADPSMLLSIMDQLEPEFAQHVRDQIAQEQRTTG